MNEKSASTSTAPLEATKWREIGSSRIEADGSFITGAANPAAEHPDLSGIPGEEPASVGVALARTYLETYGYILSDSAPSGFDIAARDGATEVMAKVRVFAKPFDVDELGELSSSEGLRRAALAHIAKTLPDSARVDLIGVALSDGGRAQIHHLIGVCEWEC